LGWCANFSIRVGCQSRVVLVHQVVDGVTRGLAGFATRGLGDERRGCPQLVAGHDALEDLFLDFAVLLDVHEEFGLVVSHLAVLSAVGDEGLDLLFGACGHRLLEGQGIGLDEDFLALFAIDDLVLDSQLGENLGVTLRRLLDTDTESLHDMLLAVFAPRCVPWWCRHGSASCPRPIWARGLAEVSGGRVAPRARGVRTAPPVWPEPSTPPPTAEVSARQPRRGRAGRTQRTARPPRTQPSNRGRVAEESGWGVVR